MKDYLKFYINGQWVDPVTPKTLDVENPATEEPFARISVGSKADVDKAVKAARAAFEKYSQTSVKERLDLLGQIMSVYQKRSDDMAHAVSEEMGCPLWLSKAAQVGLGINHLRQAIESLKAYQFERMQGTTLIRKEPIGVCGFITPWNWPLNQIGCKVAPALATGCTMILKPSEIAPINAYIYSEVLAEAGVPAGVYNMINGDGPGVGQALASHPGIDMMSITGSERAGIAVAKAAADTIKRVAQELGGKSPNIILDDADLSKAIPATIMPVMMNSGQSCNAPTRMLVPENLHDQVVAIAKGVVEGVKQADPMTGGPGTQGPVVSKAQWDKIQRLIKAGIDEGATLVAGGLGRPEGFNRGYYVKPTVFANVKNDMTIAREEIFGPVLSILKYKDIEDAIRIANDTDFGLAGYVQSSDVKKAQAVAKRIRAGQININAAPGDSNAPFGGYKHSGNGREWGSLGFEEFLEVKAVVGFEPKVA